MPFKGCLQYMASSLAAGLHSIGVDIAHVCDVVPLLDVVGVMEALTASSHATGSGGACFCSCRIPT